MGAFKEGPLLDAVSNGIAEVFSERAAEQATGKFERMFPRVGGRSLAVFLRPSKDFFIHFRDPEELYGSPEENSMGVEPVFAVDGMVYETPLNWPPAGTKILDSFKNFVLYEVCQDKVKEEDEDGVIRFASLSLSIYESSNKARQPEELEKIKLRIAQQVREDSYLKWWKRYTEPDEEGRCAVIPYTGDFFVIE
jgi:hypothetical protein